MAFFEKLPPCLVGIEACASSHHWSRELKALGHTVRLMPPAYVKPYVKRQKNDATDAEAICEAVTRANMRCLRFRHKTVADRCRQLLQVSNHVYRQDDTKLAAVAVIPQGGDWCNQYDSRLRTSRFDAYFELSC